MFGLTKDFAEKVEKHSSHFNRVLKSCLKVKNEDLLIISDYGEKSKRLSVMLAYGYYLAAKKKGLNVSLLFQNVKKGFMHADEHVVKALENLVPGSVIVLSVSNKLGRMGLTKSFRGFCRDKGHRFISATGLADAKTNHFELFMEAININYSRMEKKGLVLKKKLNKANTIRIKTDNGTDVTFNVMGMTALINVGNYKEQGSGGNMPAGEVYIPPKGYYGVEGTVVIDGSMKTNTGTVLLDEPVKLIIKEGKVIQLEGKQAHLLEETFQKYEDRAKYPYRVRHIGELGIGINPGALLIGSTIMDEKVLGTAHIGIGSNYWFGGEIKTVFHGDQIFKNPQIFIDGERITV
jgi:aminopeptidase